MKLLVVCAEKLDEYPPVIALCETLVSLGHSTTVLARNCDSLPVGLASSKLLTCVELGSRPSGVTRIVNDIAAESKIRRFCQEHAREYDIVWTTTDNSARACGKELYGVRHVMQLMELAEYVPLVTKRDMPLHSTIVPKLARRAYRVVVPEYNRAFIQQAWWKLERTPAVLPNKSVPKFSTEDPGQYPNIQNTFSAETRKILLYQGVFTEDRNFTQIIAAMDVLGEEYALYLMGVKDGDRDRMESVRDGRSNVVLIPFVPAPRHLAYTKYGYIGLLPYKPAQGRQSPLNALYCAPNKIWEYSCFGLPMIGSDVPGLASLFSGEGIGVTCDIEDSESFVSSVKRIDADYDTFANRSAHFFKSVDIPSIVQGILEGK